MTLGTFAAINHYIAYAWSQVNKAAPVLGGGNRPGRRTGRQGPTACGSGSRRLPIWRA